MKSIAWMLFIAILVTGCSRTKSAKDVSQDTPQIQLSDADEFTENDPLAEPVLEASSEVSSDVTDQALSLDDSAPVILSNNESTPVTLGDGEGEYTVQKNETLMMIAFKLYGDYGKWHDLSRRNAGKIKNGVVMAGSKIKYAQPSQSFDWSPQGNPYLIRTGDTLGGISGNVYGTAKKWKNIWENNKPLIKNPNRIFAGFTIYWLDQGKVAATSSETLEL
ncbi:MAG: LysM peptidoglycan-binding domain-containing protein [Bacteriovoracaceae bacterium]|nr:LysM peptidoglycan-binding domain-containing protein [Bacteriovoracaceae bacterium]